MNQILILVFLFLSYKAFCQCPKSFKTGVTIQSVDPRLQIEWEEIERIQQLLNEESLDAPLREGEDLSLIDIEKNRHFRSPEKEAEINQLRERLIEKFEEFLRNHKTTQADRLRVIFYERLMRKNGMTLQEIADRYGVTRKAINNQQKLILDKLRDALGEEYRVFL